MSRAVAFNPRYSKEAKRLHCKISVDAEVVQSYATKFQNKSVLREALRVLKLKQLAKNRESNILSKYFILLSTSAYFIV